MLMLPSGFSWSLLPMFLSLVRSAIASFSLTFESIKPNIAHFYMGSIDKSNKVSLLLLHEIGFSTSKRKFEFKS